MNYNFLDHYYLDIVRMYTNAVLLGAKANYFASNSTNCFNQMMNLVQFDVDLLVIKYMYGDIQNHILNTTLFLSNISDVSYVCIDVLENLYVYSMFKFDLFGRDWLNLLLAYIQNSLGAALSINKIYQNMLLYPPEEVIKIYFDSGRIVKMLLDVEPQILETASWSPGEDQDDLDTQTVITEWGKPRVT